MSETAFDKANIYRIRGWQGTLPLPPRKKSPPPAGWTGHGAPYPSGADMQAWVDDPDTPKGNLALRMPPDVLGIDVDAYGDKPGKQTLADREAEWGDLPPTAVSTSREDGISGIRLYRIPTGLRWPGQVGPGIETVHSGHRYAVVWPSIHPEGRQYQWLTPTGSVAAVPPKVEQLAALPDAWVVGLTHGVVEGERERVESADDATVRAFLDQAPQDKPCQYVFRVLMETIHALDTMDGRHDAANNGIIRLVRAADQGHNGVPPALHRLRTQFEHVATDRTPHELTAEFNRGLAGAVAKVTANATPEVDRRCCGTLQTPTAAPATTPQDEPPLQDEPPEEDDPAPTEDVFWDARHVLRHVHDFARARRCSPWAVLGVVLARVATATPPNVVLPALVGTYASLNTYVALVGPSGAGKDAAAAAAEDAIEVGHCETIGVGSGEGIAHQFVTYEKPTKDEPGGLKQYREAVLFNVAEVDTIAALTRRQASTILPELRKAWNGAALGFAYVDKEKRLKLHAHRYRLCLTVGVQPERAGGLLNDTDGGTPQRFLWMPATDPDAPDIAPDQPEPWSADRFRLPNWHSGTILRVCQTARNTIDAARLARIRGGEDEALNGHALLCRLKVAALLGILDGRSEITEQDWYLAGGIAAKSERTRHGLVETLRRVKRETNRARGNDEAERTLIVTERVEDDATKRVARRIISKLTRAGWITRSDLRNGIAARDRNHFDPAVDRLTEAGQLDTEGTGRGVRYRLTGEAT